MPAAGDNDKGFWEDIDIVALNAEMLAVLGCSWHALRSITDQDVEFLCAHGYISKSIQLLNEKTANAPLFGFKDPRTTKLLPFWKKVFEKSSFDVAYILASRNPLSVIESLGKRDHFSREKSYMLWLEYTMTAMCGVGFGHALLVDYDRLMSFPEEELERVSNWLDLPLIKEEVGKYCRDFLEKSLRHTHFDAEHVFADDAAVPLVKEVYAFLLDLQGGKIRLEDGMASGLFREWKGRLDRLQPLLKLIDRQEIRISSAHEKIEFFERKSQIVSRAVGKIKGLGRRTEFFLRAHLQAGS